MNKFWDLIRIFPYSASRIFPLWGQEQVGPFIFVHTLSFFHISFNRVFGFALAYICVVFPCAGLAGGPSMLSSPRWPTSGRPAAGSTRPASAPGTYVPEAYLAHFPYRCWLFCRKGCMGWGSEYCRYPVCNTVTINMLFIWRGTPYKQQAHW